VDVVLQVSGCCIAKSPPWPDAEHDGLPDCLDSAGQDQLRFLETARSSALVNFVAEDLLVDVPDPAAIP
jgi:hypothetical protein